MSLINLLVFIVIIGLVLWLVNTQFPMPNWLKTVMNVIAVLFCIVFLLQLAGFSGGPHLYIK